MLAVEALLLLLVCSHATLALLSKPVHISLNSSWPHSPILLEASEFISGEDSLLFWKFLERTRDLHSTTNERAIYESILEHAEQLLPPLVFNCLQLALSLHSQSPAIAMYQQLAEERHQSLYGTDDKCLPWVESGGSAFCTISSFQSSLEQDTISQQAVVYSFDHVFPVASDIGNVSSLPVAILYCQWGTVSCLHWHSEMASLASQGAIQYVFRHHVEAVQEGGSQLSGYGVQLAVKNSEYKAVDDTQIKGAGSIEDDGEDGVELDTQGFVFSTLKSLHSDLSTQLEDFRLHLEHSAREIPELKAWQLQDLGFQAAQRVVSSPPDMALSVIRDITQNLPTVARSLCRLVVKKELKSEVTANQRSLQQYGMEPGDSVVLFNGIVLQTGNTDAFSVLDVVISESRLVSGLTGLGLTLSDVHSLVHIPVHSQAQSFAVDMRSDSVVFINDLESDKEYAGWPNSLRQFLQPTFPGSLRQVARNAFNLVFCFDPASPEGVEIAEYLALFLENLVPVRLGVLLVTGEEQEVGAVLSRGFYYIASHHSGRRALNWLLQVQSNMSVAAAVDAMETEFPDAPLDVLKETSTEERQRKETAMFYETKGLHSLPQVLLNGVLLDMEEDLESAIVSQLQQQTYLLQRWVYMKKITDSTDIYQYFMQRPNVLQRLNHHITASDCLQIDFSTVLPNPIPKLTDLYSLSSHSMSALIAHEMVYYTSQNDEFAVRALSVWVVVDVSSEQGRLAAHSALSYLADTTSVQIGLLHNPSTTHVSRLARVIVAAELNGWASVTVLLSLLSSPDQALHSLAERASVNESVIAGAVDDSRVSEIIDAHTFYSRRVLGLHGRQTALLANGKLIGPLEEGQTFSEQDYAMLVQLENSSHAHAVAESLGGVEVTGISPDEDTSSFRSRLAMKVSSLLRSQPQQHRIPNPKLKERHSGVHLPAPEPLHHVITAILNPLDPTMQKWAHLLKVLQVVVPCDISIFLNPQGKLSEVPIKSFYRYVLEPELAFLPNGSLAPGPRATFSNLPHSPLLTLHMDVPHAWLVAAVHSPHDLDNIHLQSVENGVQAEFLLEHILVEGQLYDASSGQPVPGLELVLGPPSQPALYDTVVMANLGYFQLKANPGAWQLQIREGRSRDIYEIASHSGDGLWGKAEDRLSVTVRSFSGAVHIVRVEKRKGMEDSRLLHSEEQEETDDNGQHGSVWDTLSSLMGGGREDSKTEDVGVNDTINVFSIASGHLYERFLRIMMLSVLKHTQRPVKFWFLENYLSPTFKDFIPYMADHYGFEYELVQYKWPRWLHQQTEKQRLIWGYKILFLDVLFPLSVKHIIFVDADQIVRADLAELLEVPLDGAPYGYTPFCNDRPEMDGFRFWERGYWKSHLGTRRYHISALYVVDLLRFRQLAAGDRLRGQYQALSQDPNSLSNLDQDLPNNMIHQVPIKSLPQEWLWCETWCSEASKAAAKTIDLCNNPLTKEPKLARAMRILPEWSVYDQEIRQLQEARAGQHPPAPTHKHSEL